MGVYEEILRETGKSNVFMVTFMVKIPGTNSREQTKEK